MNAVGCSLLPTICQHATKAFCREVSCKVSVTLCVLLICAARSVLRRAMLACEKYIFYFDCHYVYFGSDNTRSILSDPVVVTLPALQGCPIRTSMIIPLGSFVSFSMFTSSFIFIDKKPPGVASWFWQIFFFSDVLPFSTSRHPRFPYN